MALRMRIKQILPCNIVVEIGFFMCRPMKWFTRSIYRQYNSAARSCCTIRKLKVYCLSTSIFLAITIIISTTTVGIKMKLELSETKPAFIHLNQHNPSVEFQSLTERVTANKKERIS